MATILMLNGPNLDLLGQREPGFYGSVDLQTIESTLQIEAARLGHTLVAKQAQAEHELVALLRDYADQADLLLFNPASYTHTSIVLRDTLLAISMPLIEIHLSHVEKRESFRQISYFSDIALGTISGFGALGYQMALLYADRWLRRDAWIISEEKHVHTV